MILEDWYGRTLDDCNNPSNDWFKLFLEKTKVHSKNERVWLSIDSILPRVAKEHPESLLEIVQILKEIWMTGTYVGDLKIIFSSYQDIADQKKRTEVMAGFQKIYSELRSENPHLAEMSFVA